VPLSGHFGWVRRTLHRKIALVRADFGSRGGRCRGDLPARIYQILVQFQEHVDFYPIHGAGRPPGLYARWQKFFLSPNPLPSPGGEG
jgi:hypothetical protein